MPELPEVETVVRELRRVLKGLVFERVQINFSRVDGLQDLTGHRVADVKRRGKLIILETEKDVVLLVHLKMTGQLVFDQEPHKHTHIIFEFNNGKKLNFNDIRKFGFVELTDAQGLQHAIEQRFAFGPEPLSKAFTLEYFKEQLAKRSAPIKSVLLDQTVVAGLGNIYVDESLYGSHIHPLRFAKSLSAVEAGRLHKTIVEVLKEAVARGGSSSQNYVRTSGKRGTYSDLHKVYRKTGQPCPRCGTEIERIVVGGRGTHFCPKCQKI